MNNCMYCRRSCPGTALTYIHIDMLVLLVVCRGWWTAPQLWPGEGGLRNHSIMSSAAVMNPTHATHKPHNSLHYCWSGFIHIWQFRLMVLFRFACRKTQQVTHTQVSHIPICMHTSLLMWDNMSILVNCEAVLLTISSSYTPIAMDCHDTTGTCVTSYECDVINWLHLRHTW